VYSNQPVLSPDIFDYLSLILNAREVHTIDSAFLCLIDTFPQVPSGRLFFHRYVRDPKDDWIHPGLVKDWTVLV
jgi:hypothetical protein